MKKFFNCLCISLMCMALVGCGSKSSTGVSDIDLDNENIKPIYDENSLKFKVEMGIDSERTNILKKYKVYLYDGVDLTFINEENGNYTYEINLTCEANSKEVCENIYDELYEYALNAEYYGIIVVK